MKTLAQLKRDANTGGMRLELIERYGKTDIPERMKGDRSVLKANSVALILVNKNGELSELRIKSAKLIEYTDTYLTIYEAGEREPNEQEKIVLNGIKNIYNEYENSFNSPYWRVKDYCKNSPCPYMCGNETIKGKRYQTYNGMVRDSSIKGEAILKYKVHFD